MSKICELFAISTQKDNVDWRKILENQYCIYLNKKCTKTRKSTSEISIGTCTVAVGKYKNESNIIICPHRLIERKQIFMDCIHLLSNHQPGNELHLLSEIQIPGGNVDYILASTDSNRNIKDFVGIELQTLDTTGTVWPERERFLTSKGIEVNQSDIDSNKTYGVNWKMTAKTILVQLHHKIETFESLNKKLVLITQDCLLEYIKNQFTFNHIQTTSSLNDSMFFHSYGLDFHSNNKEYRLNLNYRFSTNAVGVERLLGLNANSIINSEALIKSLESKISDKTIITI